MDGRKKTAGAYAKHPLAMNKKEGYFLSGKSYFTSVESTLGYSFYILHTLFLHPI